MKTLTIRFIYDVDIISRLIEWETNSLWCHTETLNRAGTGWIGAHAGSGVADRTLDYCKPSHERRYALEVTDAQYETAMTWLESMLGTKYNYLDIAGQFFKVRGLTSQSREICSSLMTDFMMKAGLEPLNLLPGYTYLISPETLHLSPLFIGKSTEAL